MVTPDLFAPPKDERRILGDCWLCGGEHICESPEICYPLEPLPEEPRK